MAETKLRSTTHGPRNAGPRLSVAMIVRSCEAELAATLRSVRDLADEIVVLDTGSTDGTRQVASQGGARVVQQPWENDFAAARNACLKHASGDWVLWLDSGETLPDQSAANLQRALASDLAPEQAYLLRVVVPAAEGQIGGEQISQVRLHPRHAKLQFAGRVRETLDASLAVADMSIGELDIEIHRTGREHLPELRASRARRNVRLADLAIAAEGPTAVMENCLGEALQTLGDPLRAAQHYREAQRLAEPRSREQLDAFYGLLTCLDVAGPNRQAQVSLCLEALESFPLDAQLLVALGGYLRSLNHLELALRAYDIAHCDGQIEPRLSSLVGVREIARRCAAAAREQLGTSTEMETRTPEIPASTVTRPATSQGQFRIDTPSEKAILPAGSNAKIANPTV